MGVGDCEIKVLRCENTELKDRLADANRKIEELENQLKVWRLVPAKGYLGSWVACLAEEGKPRIVRVQREKRLYENLGYDPDDLDPVMEEAAFSRGLIHHQDVLRVCRQMGAHLRGKTPYYQAIYRIRTKSGLLRWVSDWGAVVDRAIDGRPLRFIGRYIDVTETKDAEERLKKAVDGAGACWWDWNLSSGEVMRSPHVAEILEFRPEEIEPTLDFLTQRIHPKDMPKVLKHRSDILAGRTNDYRVEHRILTKGGKFVWIQDRGRVVEWDHDGKAVRVIGTCFDITREKLERAEQRYQELFKEVTIGIQAVDDEGRFVEANPEFLKMLGYSEEGELVGRLAYKDVTPADWHDREMDILANRRISGEKWVTYEKEYVTKDGARIPVELKVGPLIGENGHNAEGLWAVVRDISARKDLEKTLQALRHEEEKLSLLNKMPVLISFVDAEERFISANETHAKWFNRSMDSILKHSVREVVGDKIYDQIRDGIKAALSKDNASCTVDLSVDAKDLDGRLLNFACRFSTCFDVSGSVTGFAALVTDRSTLVGTLRRAQRAMKDFLDSNIIVMRIDRKGRIKEINEFGSTFFQLGSEALLGESVVGTILFDTTESRTLIEQICRDPSSIPEKEINNRRADDTRVWVAWIHKGILDDTGNLAEVLCIGRDVTALKMAEEDACGFALGMVHELKVVSYDINSHKSKLQDNLDDTLGEVKRLDATIKRSLPKTWSFLKDTMPDRILHIDRQVDVIRTLWDRLCEVKDAMTGHLTLREVNLERLIGNIKRNMAEGFNIHWELGNLPCIIADEAAIETVLRNLLHNAVTYLKIGRQGVVRVDTSESEDFISVCVLDNGRGVPPDALSRIFRAFNKVKDTTLDKTTRRHGLGLYIAERLVQNHGGTIRCHSRLGAWTEFIFTIPKPHLIEPKALRSIERGSFTPSN